VTTPIDVRLCINFWQSPQLVRICALQNIFLHETNNILLLYIKNNVVQCIGASATNTHVYARTYTPTKKYTYTCINICTFIYTHTLVHLCELICSIGIIFINMTWWPLGVISLEMKESFQEFNECNLMWSFNLKPCDQAKACWTRIKSCLF
jgi:hypothetical protein